MIFVSKCRFKHLRKTQVEVRQPYERLMKLKLQ